MTLAAATAPRPGLRLPARLARLLAPVLLVGAVAMPAAAEMPNGEAAVQRLEKLEATAADLEIQLAALGAPPAEATSNNDSPRRGVVPVQNLPQGYAAQVEVRLTQLERQISELTGRLERLQYEQSQVQGRLDRALADMEYRLTVLEGGDPGAAPTQTRGSLDSGGGTTTGSLSAGSGTLGTGGGSLSGSTSGASAPADAAGLGSVSSGGTLGTLSGSTASGGTLNSGSLNTGTIASGSLGGGTLGGTQTAATNAGDVMAQYDAAYGRLQRNDWAGAEQAFSAFLQNHGDHPLASNAQYWLGETYYARGQYPQAATAFARGYQRFPGGAKATDSLLKLGMSLGEMGQTGDACLTFGQLLQDYPNATTAVRRRVDSLQSRYNCN